MFCFLVLAVTGVPQAQNFPAFSAPEMIALSSAEARPQYGLDILQDRYHAQIHTKFQDIVEKQDAPRYTFGLTFAPAPHEPKTQVYANPETEAPEEGLLGFLCGLPLPLPLCRLSRRF